MIFKTNKDEVVRALECIVESQSKEQDFWGNYSVSENAEYLLKLILLLPVECTSVLLSEEDAEFLARYF